MNFFLQLRSSTIYCILLVASVNLRTEIALPFVQTLILFTFFVSLAGYPFPIRANQSDLYQALSFLLYDSATAIFTLWLHILVKLVK